MEGHRSTFARAHFPTENTDSLVEIRAFTELVSELWDSFFDVPLCLKLLFSYKIAERYFLLDYNIFKYFNILTFQKNEKLLSVLILSQTGIYRFKIYQYKILTPVLKTSQYHGLWINEMIHLLSFIRPSICLSIHHHLRA